MSMFRSPLLILLLIAALVLAACDSGEDDVLPTALVLPEQTEEAVPEVVAPPDAVDEADDEDADGPEVAPTDEAPVVDDEEVVPDEDAGPPGAPAPGDDGAPEGFDPDEVPVGPEGAFPVGEAVTDFSEVILNESMLIVGELRFVPVDADEEDGDSMQDPLLLLVDENGVELVVNFPPPAAHPYDGEMVEVFGVVRESDDEADERRILIPNSLQSLEERDADDVSMPPFADGPGSSSPLMFMMDLLTPLEIEVEPELTALAAYDALVEGLGDELDGLDWISVRGDSLSGWFIEFRNSEDDTWFTYVITAAGEALAAEPEVNPQAPGMILVPLERERIVTDSDQIEAVLEEADTSPPDSPFATVPELELRAGEDDSISWIVFGFEVLLFDATAEVTSVDDAVSPTAGDLSD